MEMFEFLLSFFFFARAPVGAREARVVSRNSRIAYAARNTLKYVIYTFNADSVCKNLSVCIFLTYNSLYVHWKYKLQLLDKSKCTSIGIIFYGLLHHSIAFGSFQLFQSYI